METSQLQYLTNEVDLTRLAARCRQCYESLQFGRNIITHEKLPTKILRTKSNTLNAFIINTNTQQQQQQQQQQYPDRPAYGHWITLLIHRNIALICDGIAYAKSRIDVWSNIEQFCRNNKCKLVYLDLNCQPRSSAKCGYHSLGFIAKYHTLPLHRFYSLQYFFKRNNIKSNERFMMTFVQKHFKFRL